MTNQHRPSLWLSSFLFLTAALTGCGLDNSNAHFSVETALVEVGRTHDVVLSDVVDLSLLHVRGSNDNIGFSVMTVPGFLFGERQVVRVHAMAQGEATLELLDDDTVLDTITVEAGTVHRIDVEANDDRYGEEFAGEYGLLVGQDTLLRFVARDALGRTFDDFATRSIVEHPGFELIIGWSDTYIFRAAADGTHTLTLESDSGPDFEVDVTAVLPADVSELRINVAEENRGTCVAVSGRTDAGLPILGIEPAFQVDGETSDIPTELGVFCFEDEPARGTEVTAIWHELSVTHTF
jgi:hypothetical protein